MSPYGVAAGHCVGHPPQHIVERWHRAAAAPTTPAGGNSVSTTSRSAAAAALAPVAQEVVGNACTAVNPGVASAVSAAAVADAEAQKPPLPLGGRVYRLTKFAEKPTAEFARENLVTPGLGPAGGKGGEGRHLVVFGQVIPRFIGGIARRSSFSAEGLFPSLISRLRHTNSGSIPPPLPRARPNHITQYILPARRTFNILAEDIRLDRRER